MRRQGSRYVLTIEGGGGGEDEAGGKRAAATYRDTLVVVLGVVLVCCRARFDSGWQRRASSSKGARRPVPRTTKSCAHCAGVWTLRSRSDAPC